jgi:hypothetical protein
LVKIPFWDYRGENRIPSIGYMEQQISEHIREHLLTCIGDFSGFADLYDIEAGEMIIESSIADENVILDIDYPLDIILKVGGTSREMRRFGSKLDVNLGKMHVLATQILEEEQRINYMENITLDLMSLNPKVPFTGLDFSCNPKMWFVEDVKEDVQEVLQITLPRIRVKNTDYLPFEKKLSFYEKLRKKAGQLRTALEEIDYNQEFDQPTFEIAKQQVNLPDDIPDDAYDYFHLFVDVGAEDSEYKVSFTYDPTWGIDFRAAPSRSGMLRSNMAHGQKNFFSFLCINQYHFVYDVVYPVKVTIRDRDSFEGEGMFFNFAFPVYINDNLADRSPFGARIVDIPDITDGFCANKGGDEVEITVRSAGFGEELKNISIGYKCFNVYCDLGKTSFQSGETHYRLDTQLPEGCAFPFLYAKKEGYLEGSIQYLGEENVEIPIQKLRKVPIQVVKHVYQSSNNKMGPAEPLDPEQDKVIITLSVINGSYDQFESYPSTTPTRVPSLELLEEGGDYAVTIMLIKEGKLIGKTRQPDKLIGGYSNEHLVLEAGDVNQADTIVFHVFEYRPFPAKMKDAAPMLLYLFDSNYLGVLPVEFR